MQIYINITYAMQQNAAEASARLHRPWLACVVIMHHWYCILYSLRRKRNIDLQSDNHTECNLLSFLDRAQHKRTAAASDWQYTSTAAWGCSPWQALAYAT